ncbi:MAG: hydrolase [Acidobacteria bacterium]|nr:hydrolase [Acidobacteriota bacterium]
MQEETMRGRVLVCAVGFLILINSRSFLAGQAVRTEPSRVSTVIGVFYGVQGLGYQSSAGSGATNEKGEFKYSKNEKVMFAIGDIVLGSASVRGLMTPAHLVPSVDGDVKKITNQVCTNMARFLQSLDQDANVENGINITPQIRSAVSKYKDKINFDQTEEAFTADPNVTALFASLKLTLRTGPQARNYLRRTLYGIRKSIDVKIPTRDGSYLLADVYRPIAEGKYPPIVNSGAYGKRLIDRGCNCNPSDVLNNEDREDTFFEGKLTMGFGDKVSKNTTIERSETANTVDYVPRGYVMVVANGRGICETPGKFEQFSLQEAKDFYDLVEWAGVQSWSNGNVGSWGISYWSMVMLNMAQLQPPHLKAIMPHLTDENSVRDYMYNGGLWNFFNGNVCQQCIDGKTYSARGEGADKLNTVDWVKNAKANPFDDPALYGPEGSAQISPDLSKITIPFFTTIPTEHPGIHIRGSSEFYINAGTPPQNKRLAIAEFAGEWDYSKTTVAQHLAFFDYWLKGINKEAFERIPPVQMKVRTGGGQYVMQYENEWPIARTEYRKYYLDASPASSYNVTGGDGLRRDLLKMGEAPAFEASQSYSAEVKKDDPCWASGVSFVTEPLQEDITLAGYSKLVAWVSATSSDMDLMVYVRALDLSNQADNQRVVYSIGTSGDSPKYNPIALGWLKVSHRKLDPEKSTVYRPYHTHKEEDYAPLKSPSEVVPVEVEIWPATGVIKKGWRIRLDVQPADGCDAYRHEYDASYHTGATNTIHTGPSHPSYLQLPVIPPKK